MLVSSEVLKTSNVSFGTSGARGLVTDFTADVCAAFTLAFVNSISKRFNFSHLALAIDNRPSSYQMAMNCAALLEQIGITPVYYGVLPTPALAYSSMNDGIPAIMITGSHIPFDRNGLKFYRPDGEITKQDELDILADESIFVSLAYQVKMNADANAGERYKSRYTELFSDNCLLGKRIGIYEHSSSGRDLYKPLFESLGAEVISLERTDTFVPIDTEAVSEDDKVKARGWSKEYKLDAIFSTDGDGDRPLVADENGEWLRGDVLGILCAKALNVEALSVPVSCNTAIELSDFFECVVRTKIGSPYVIAEFADLAKDKTNIAGFEANGGFILGSDIKVNNKTLKALPTRDAVLPAIMLLTSKQSITSCVKELPSRFTYSDRIKNFETSRSQEIIKKGIDDTQQLLSFLGFDDHKAKTINTVDGLRITLENGDVIHLRPSGNAPELRCYSEADNLLLAQYYVDKSLESLVAQKNQKME
jgi:phosphomannomutase